MISPKSIQIKMDKSQLVTQGKYIDSKMAEWVLSNGTALHPVSYFLPKRKQHIMDRFYLVVGVSTSNLLLKQMFV